MKSSEVMNKGLNLILMFVILLEFSCRSQSIELKVSNNLYENKLADTLTISATNQIAIDYSLYKEADIIQVLNRKAQTLHWSWLDQGKTEIVVSKENLKSNADIDFLGFLAENYLIVTGRSHNGISNEVTPLHIMILKIR